MNCPNCGGRTDGMGAVCTNCGRALGQEATPATPPVPAFEPATVVTAAPAPQPIVNVVPPAPPGPGAWTGFPAATPGAPPQIDAAAIPRYAGFWRRFWTMFVDYLVCFPFGLALRIALGVGLFDPDWTRESVIVFAFGVISGWLYDAFMESSKWQGTLGQQLLGVRVTDRAGRRISFARATARHVAQYLSIFTLGVGYLVMLFNRRRLTLHDWISGCQIVRGGLEAPVAQPVVPASPAAGPTLVPSSGGAGR